MPLWCRNCIFKQKQRFMPQNQHFTWGQILKPILNHLWSHLNHLDPTWDKCYDISNKNQKAAELWLWETFVDTSMMAKWLYNYYLCKNRHFDWNMVTNYTYLVLCEVCNYWWNNDMQTQHQMFRIIQNAQTCRHSTNSLVYNYTLYSCHLHSQCNLCHTYVMEHDEADSCS